MERDGSPWRDDGFSFGSDRSPAPAIAGRTTIGSSGLESARSPDLSSCRISTESGCVRPASALDGSKASAAWILATTPERTEAAGALQHISAAAMAERRVRADAGTRFGFGWLTLAVPPGSVRESGPVKSLSHLDCLAKQPEAVIERGSRNLASRDSTSTQDRLGLAKKQIVQLMFWQIRD